MSLFPTLFKGCAVLHAAATHDSHSAVLWSMFTPINWPEQHKVSAWSYHPRAHVPHKIRAYRTAFAFTVLDHLRLLLLQALFGRCAHMFSLYIYFFLKFPCLWRSVWLLVRLATRGEKASVGPLPLDLARYTSYTGCVWIVKKFEFLYCSIFRCYFIINV